MTCKVVNVKCWNVGMLEDKSTWRDYPARREARGSVVAAVAFRTALAPYNLGTCRARRHAGPRTSMTSSGG
jgi:hypothetical protein